MNGAVNDTQTLSWQALLILLQPGLQTRDLRPLSDKIFYRALTSVHVGF